MKILLDIDGVMVITPPWKRIELLVDGFSAFNERSVRNLNLILQETAATIILTTSHKWNYSIDEWMGIFKRRNISLTALERLPENLDYLNRRDEILHWLNLSGDTDFVIIDDDKSLNDLPSDMKRKLVLTDFLVGLDDQVSIRAIEILSQYK